MLLTDKVALVTGGAGLNGLGFATARMMAAQGARVVILDLERANPAGAAAELGPQHIGLVADVTDKASCERAAKAVLEQCGRIDILVNNAGITQPRKTTDITAADYDAVRQDIRGVVDLAHGSGAIVKVILETCLLTFEEKLRASELALSAGADFLKTSTGFSTGGATADDIALLRGVAGSRAGVKASGGIRSLADASAMLHAGASRIGASASVKIVHELSSHDLATPASPASC